VDPSTLEAWWVDLRQENITTRTQVLVPNDQRFDKTAKREIGLRCGHLHRDLLARRVMTDAADFEHLRSKEHVKPAARKLYLKLRDAGICIGSDGPKVHFTRWGWKHITRASRPQLTRYQSFTLLGCVRKILESTPLDEFQEFRSPDRPKESYIAARAAVSFSFRQTAIVKLVLKQGGRPAAPRYLFHTIYEPRRRRNVLGAREPRSP